MLKEVCVENLTLIPEKISKGAQRVELCDNLSVGGTTVSHGVAVKAIDYCRRHNAGVMAMVRPRGGDFVYRVEEIEVMKEDIIHLKQLGADGVVFGCLTEDGWIDEGAMKVLLELAEGLETVFHMAFDHIRHDRQLEAIDWLAEHGVNPILTHGGPSESGILENLPRLQEYMEHAAGRITIMPGGGITDENLPEIAAELDIREIHGTRIVG
ncbi:copper homeostasis protein CutC [Bacillus infantis]|uniref:copper homeostasis protein CutC n=1 Tax=Bacillus infantis TaxID=324767 RepID=UPI001CD1CE1C|nr:copper homeostasis protein CutC [Bacillus infantis]MCA1033093.1 copper homeostasis protein CutC [Bacillus infantis]